ncbi:Postreplication repair E3 ubiquitin-protein ligase rad18 [Pleurostoma richardsiae]|uniref:Postreplication repair E3 ubiquitin-protein ligase RAD18 n=1 Tax=Pleurostoma richardsiae TaxID=41990 RepID=A0AA38S4D7_9PEZI|nr:Postreplication repair E3 ubiquitin-protein ligase rad18 [Pleurostoma richardsiae]
MDAQLTGPVSKDDPYDVPDSTDWLGTPLAGLLPLEQALRCHVCKDFYNSPMITSCSHTFCSLCIRRALSVDGKCPLCRVTDQESKLRGNWAIREAVDSFVKARDAVLGLARVPVAATPTSPKRKAVDGDEYGGRGAKRTRTSARLSKTRGAEATTAMVLDEVDVPEWEDTVDYQPDDGLVECPICLKRMKPHSVDRHLDTTCPGAPTESPGPRRPSHTQPSFSGSFRSQHSSSPALKPTPERLPSLNYSILNDSTLRKKLSALGISTFGSRQLLEKRHKEWITLWNANCDSDRPKRKHELLHDLDVWERTQGAKAQTQSRSANLGAQIKDKDFDGAAWAAKHEDSFKDLIAAARKSRAQAEKKADDAQPGNRASQTDTKDTRPVATIPQALHSHQLNGEKMDLVASEVLYYSTPPVAPHGSLPTRPYPIPQQDAPTQGEHSIAFDVSLDGQKPRFFAGDETAVNDGTGMSGPWNGSPVAPS